MSEKDNTEDMLKLLNSIRLTGFRHELGTVVVSIAAESDQRRMDISMGRKTKTVCKTLKGSAGSRLIYLEVSGGINDGEIWIDAFFINDSGNKDSRMVGHIEF